MDKVQVLNLIKSITIKDSSADINYLKFYENFRLKAGKNVSEKDAYTVLEQLESENEISLKKSDNIILSIYWENYFIEKIENLYDQIKVNESMPFPSTEYFKEEFPATMIQKINVKTEFLPLLKGEIEVTNKIILLDFVDIEKNILVFEYMLTVDLINFAVAKVKFFLQDENNREYIKGKISPHFGANEKGAMNSMLRTIVDRKDEAVDSLKKSNSFSFKFWSVLANTLVKDFGHKKSFDDKDFMFAQSAYMIGFFNVFCKSIFQKEGNIENSKEIVRKNFLKKPFVFSLEDILNFTDNSGNLLVKKIGKEVFYDLVKNILKEKSSTNLPLIIKIKVNDEKDFFIHQSVISQYILDGVDTYSNILLEDFIEDWKRSLNSYQTMVEMKEDKIFYDALVKKLVMEAPALYAMLDYKLISLLIKEEYVSEKDKTDLEKLIDYDNQKLQSILTIFNLNRKQIYSHVKFEVPFWKVNPFFKNILNFILSLFGATTSIKKKSAPEKKDNLDFKKVAEKDYSSSIDELKTSMLGENFDAEKELKQCVKDWNPLFDETARNNLVEDLNSLIRDHVRKFKRSFVTSPPDKKRIEEMSAAIMLNPAFEKIKNKDSLQYYIQIYLLELISNIKLFK